MRKVLGLRAPEALGLIRLGTGESVREITLQSPPFTYIVYRITRPGAGLRACTLQPSRSSRIKV